MARVISYLPLAKKDGIIVYEMYGALYMRSKPLFVKQTRATVKAARLFGKASTHAAFVLRVCKPVLPEITGRTVSCRLRTALFRWMNEVQRQKQTASGIVAELSGLSLNSNAHAALPFKYNVEFKGNTAVQIKIPATVPSKLLHIPRGCKSVAVNIAVVVLKPFSELHGHVSMQQLNMPLNSSRIAGQELELPVNIQAQSLCLVIITVTCINAAGMPCSYGTGRQKPPALIASAFYRG